MKVTILQQNIEWNLPKVNFENFGRAIDQNLGSDLYVLPEMFSTGFCTTLDNIDDSVGRDSLAWMQCKSKEVDAAIAGSVIVEEGGRHYNRFYFVKPDGMVEYYDKHHLFTYGNEHLHFAAGGERVVVEWRGVRILLLICYDLRFPVWSRYRGDYDMIICVASWPTSRIEVWNTLLKARAIENQCYVVGVNRVGEDCWGDYKGCSAVIDARGERVAACTDNEQSVATAIVDLNTLNAFRAKFPVLQDADKWEMM